MRRLHPLWLQSLLIGGIVSSLILLIHASPTTQGNEEEDWAEIAKLHDRGWKELKDQDFEASETTFRLATSRLKRYRDGYIESESSIRFLRATYRLGYFAELGGEDVKAKSFYEECLVHPLINSAGAVADGEPISQRAKDRLRFVERRLRETAKRSEENYPHRSAKGGSANRSKEDYPHISVKGGSKGGAKNLPALSVDLRP